ncbi:MAG TPA: acylphosphatase [Methanoregula sp.]|nr:acylphosphatase [Methanoregula sp.]
MKSIEILISGKVQRVGYRACVRRIATDLHVTGTVVNLPDGRVRIHASAEPMILEKFVSMIYSCPRAVIRDIKTSEIPGMHFTDFSIIKGESRLSTEL